MLNFIKNVDKTNENIKCTAIIVSSGSSSRMGDKGNKLFFDILGKPVLSYSIESFQECHLVSEIILVTKVEDIIYCKDNIVDPFELTKVKKIIAGGSERQFSVYNGLREADEDTDIIIIHDGARPMVSVENIEDCIYECMEHKAVISGVKVKDTIKVIDEQGFIIDTPDRTNLWAAQTPQAFDYQLVIQAYEKAIEDGFVGTDDASIIERLGYKVRIVEGDYQNIKITTGDDLNFMESLLENDL